MRIAIASGKGGTGKTSVAVNLARVCAEEGENPTYVDCDVEEPNGHIFLKPDISDISEESTPVPRVDASRCTGCGSCGQACQTSAIVVLASQPLTFPELCNGCGLCARVCPEEAITEVPKAIGTVEAGTAGSVGFLRGVIKVGQAISPPLIRKVKARAPAEGLVLFDAPPGTSCPVIHTVRDCDYVVLVAEPTPFSLHDLELALGMVRVLGLRAGCVVNRDGVADGRTLDALLDREGIPVLGRIPDDRQVAVVYSRGGLVVDELPALRARFRELWLALREEAGQNGGTP